MVAFSLELSKLIGFGVEKWPQHQKIFA